jgi:asparagine synthase (glutamine-hydrolysing)
MCGIAAIVDLGGGRIPDLESRLERMNELIAHRGPDGEGYWRHEGGHVGLAHRRLSIIDLSTGDQPMTDNQGNWIVYSGEIYNYKELRAELGADQFRTKSDTEVILIGYRRWGAGVVSRLRGMFAFALWDESRSELFCARDRLGMKPLAYAQVGERVYLASEAKALLPFLPSIETDEEALLDYLAFQACLDGKTLFKGIRELPPGHTMTLRRGGGLTIARYWNVYYSLDLDSKAEFFQREIRDRLAASVNLHVRADVPIGAYLSGGFDSSIIARLARDEVGPGFPVFNGRFDMGPDYDESHYARLLAESNDLELVSTEITVDDFVEQISNVIYHLDWPVAGPGSFPQFMVSRDAAARRKVVLGGQGGDEMFGGYARYLIAYFEQVLKAAIDGTMHTSTFIVDYRSILPNLGALRKYKPALQEFWRDGLFDEMDRRYFRLVNRSHDLGDVINSGELSDYSPYDTFHSIFHADNAAGGSYFDRMTHFDFKALLPGLLHVEDRVSMAHGLESRLPFLDHPLVELAATIPAAVKFETGQMKRVLRQAFAGDLPQEIVNREDKMGFPTPIVEWARGDAREFVADTLSCRAATSRRFVDNQAALARLDAEPQFGRGFWGVFSLELWQQRFHDRASEFLYREEAVSVIPAQRHEAIQAS